MKVLIAPDSFKESLSALEVARNIELGIKKVTPETTCFLLPMADGGEGTVQSLVDATEGQIIQARVHDPLMRKINRYYGMLGDGKTAIIEMASASGLGLLKEDERNPYITTTFGTGELIISALDQGCKEIMIGIGGSATNDGGMGMATALGVKFLDEHGDEVEQGGKQLIRIRNIDTSGMIAGLENVRIIIASDVSNPLTGKNGASTVYGPQKGASSDQVKALDTGLDHYGNLIEEKFGMNVKSVPGSGAAGGLGAGLMTFLNAKMKPGFEIVKEITNLEEHIKDVDLVITGEGKIDFQTQYGKTPFGVAMTAKKYDKPVIAIVGSIGENISVLYKKGFDSILSIIEKPCTLEYAMKHASALIQNAAERSMRMIQINN